MTAILRRTYNLSDAAQLGKHVVAIIDHIEKEAVPVATKYTLDAISAKARTKAIRYMAMRARVPQWIIRKRMNRRWQRKANLTDYKRTGVMSAKTQMLTADVSAVGLLGTAKQPPSGQRMKAIQKARRGVKAGRHNFPQAFVADGGRRTRDAKYDKYIKDTYGANKVLMGKYWLIMERTSKKAYPLKAVKIKVDDFAGRALDTYHKRVFRTDYSRIYNQKHTYAMSRVRL